MEDEVRDDGEPFDALRDSEDRAQANPVEELISEDTLIDEVEIPGFRRMRLNEDANGGSFQPG